MAWSSAVVIGIWMACIALFFQAVGYSIPFWYVYTAEVGTKTFMGYASVWYFMACEKGEAGSCKSEPITPNYTESTINILEGTDVNTMLKNAVDTLGNYQYWWALQITTTIGLGFVFLAALLLVCCRCAGIHSKGFFIIAAILLFFGGLIDLTMTVIYSIGLGEVFKFKPSDYTVDADSFPWSVLLFGIGSILTLVSFVIIFVVVWKWKKLGSYFESDKHSFHGNGAPMSNLSKSYDRPRKPNDYRRDDYYDRRDDKYNNRDFSRSKKYRGDSGRDYSRDYDRNYDQGYHHGYAYEQGGYNRGYDQGYDHGYDAQYAPANRSGEYIYRPYRY